MSHKPIQISGIFHLDSFIGDLLARMEFDKAAPETRDEMRDLMERQILYRLMTALSLNLDTEAAALFAIEAQKADNNIANVVTKVIEENDAAYKAVIEELDAFEKETLETFRRFKTSPSNPSKPPPPTLGGGSRGR